MDTEQYRAVVRVDRELAIPGIPHWSRAINTLIQSYLNQNYLLRDAADPSEMADEARVRTRQFLNSSLAGWVALGGEETRRREDQRWSVYRESSMVSVRSPRLE